MALKQNLLKNGVSSGIQKFVRLLDQIILVPFFITYWGADYYGEWITITIFPTILAFSDFGIGTAASNTFVLRYVSGNFQGAKDILKSGFYVITFLIIIGSLLSISVLFFLDKLSLLDKLIIPKNDIFWAVSFLMLARLLNFYQQLFGGNFRAARKAYVGINLQSSMAILNLIMGIIILMSGGKIILFSIGILLISLVFNPIIIIAANNYVSLENLKGTVYKTDIKNIANKGFGYLLSPVWQAIYFQGTTFVVRILLGPSAVAIFNTVRTLTRSINQIFGLINNSIFPEIQFAIGKNNFDNVRKIYRFAIGLVVLLAIFGSAFLILFGNDIYTFWTSNSLIPPEFMIDIFAIGIIFNAIWWTSGVVFNAMNEPYEYAMAGLICSILSIVLSYFLIKQFGLNGAAMGCIFLDILLVFYVLPKSSKMIKQPFKSLPLDIIKEGKNFINSKHFFS